MLTTLLRRFGGKWPYKIVNKWLKDFCCVEFENPEGVRLPLHIWSTAAQTLDRSILRNKQTLCRHYTPFSILHSPPSLCVCHSAPSLPITGCQPTAQLAPQLLFPLPSCKQNSCFLVRGPNRLRICRDGSAIILALPCRYFTCTSDCQPGRGDSFHSETVQADFVQFENVAPVQLDTEAVTCPLPSFYQ